jgi:hypothetical protein
MYILLINELPPCNAETEFPDKFDNVLNAHVCVPCPFDEPMLIPIIPLVFVIFEIVLFEIELFAPEDPVDIPINAEPPVVILLNVLLLIVFDGPLEDPTPSVFIQQSTVVVPERVTFEKLLKFSVI